MNQPTMPHEPPAPMTYNELAVYLRRSVNTLRHDVHMERIPFVKMNGKKGQVLFIKSEIDEWLLKKSKKARVK